MRMSSTVIGGEMSCLSSCAPPEGRKAALADAKRRIDERKGQPVGPRSPRVSEVPELVAVGAGRRGGRREWFRVARRELEDRRARARRADPA